MSDFSRVLCAINLTESSRRVLDCALWWARSHGADVSVLCVHQVAVPSPDTLHGDAMGGSPSSALTPGDTRLTPEERQARQAELERFVEHSRTAGLQIELLLDEDSSVPDAIVMRADALAADLIVIGAGADPTSQHPVLGRSTLDVLRAAPCSVLVIPAPTPGVALMCAAGLGRVMCAVSLSDESRPLLDCAATLADQAAAHLTVVHVVELFSEVAALAYDFDQHREARVEPACAELVALVAAVVGRDKPVEEVVAQGNASHEILKLAADDSADLIVVGWGSDHGGRSAGHPTGGAIARQARCPVLFVHDEAAAIISRPFSSDGRPEPREGWA